ncbi:MAG: class I SAM-dependent methyltransferase [Gemmatimonadaceae bacterium]
MDQQFDASEFWRSRMYKDSSLVATGTSGMPLTWQQWMYRSKRRVLTSLLHRAGVTLRGEVVLNFGCGNGYFESAWESEGAARADGIDISPEAVARLRTAFPHRRYLAGDLGAEAVDLAIFGSPKLITAIDVLYHVVDDSRAARIVGQLAGMLQPDAYFLMTEGANTTASLSHVRCRSEAWWQSVWRASNLEFVAEAPVFVLQDRAVRGARHLPSMAGWILGGAQYVADLAALKIVPHKARTVAWLLQRAS